MWTLLLWLTTAGAVDCEQPTANTDLAAVLSATEVSWIRMDLDAFEVSYDNAQVVLSCLEEPVTPTLAASFHRLQALGAFVHEDFAGVIASYRSSLALEPEHVLSLEVAPIGHPLRDQYELAALATTSPLEALAPHKGVTLWMDGAKSSSRPTERPIILQAAGPLGAIEQTTWLPARAPVPTWATAPPATVEREKREKREGMPPARVALLTTAVGAGVGAAGTYALGWSTQARFDDRATAYEDLQGIRRTNHITLVTSGVLLGVAVGTGTSFALVSTW